MKRIVTLICVSAVLAGCSKVLDGIAPRGSLTTDMLTSTDLNKLTNGVLYNMESFISGGWWDGDLMGENFMAGPGGGALVDVLVMTPSTPYVQTRWNKSMTTLRQVNELIASATGSSAADENALKTAYFCRALIYYNMVTRWGTAPIIRKVTNDEIPLSDADACWAFIIEDLLEALKHPATNTGAFYVGDDAVNALLAKSYLWAGDKVNAAARADQVLSGGYALAGTSEELAQTWCYGTSSPETVFALANRRTTSQITLFPSTNDTDGSWNYSIPYPTAEKPDTPDLYATLFADVAGVKAGDIRRAVVQTDAEKSRILKFPNGNDAQNQFVKNEDATQSPLVVIRIAEMYLVKAEALGNTVEGRAALQSLLQKRYASAAIPATLTQTGWEDLLLDEYQREFYAEGHRWFDLKRTGRTDKFRTLDGRDYLMLWPIPQREIDLVRDKGAYPQNPDYPVTAINKPNN